MPTIYDDVIYLGEHDNFLHAFSFKDGRELWKFQTGGVIVTNPCIYNDVIYFGSCDENFYAVNLNGKLVWRFQTGGPIITSPVIRNNMLYFGSWDCNLYAIDISKQKVLWKFRTGMPPGKPIFLKDISAIERIKQKLKSLIWKPELPKMRPYETTRPENPRVGFFDTPYERKGVYTIGDTTYTTKGEYVMKKNDDKRRNVIF